MKSVTVERHCATNPTDHIPLDVSDMFGYTRAYHIDAA